MQFNVELQKLGLTQDQAYIYETLVAVPALPVRLIAKKSGISRELAYVVLEQLQTIGLVEKHPGTSKVSLFRAVHPREMKKLLEKKMRIADEAKQAYENIVTPLLSNFNAVHNRPHVKFYEGIEGLLETYKEILDEAKTVYVLRSLYDYENKEIRALVSAQLEKQAKAKIRSYVLSPKLPHMQPELHTHNPERNITRKILPQEKFTLPAQIILYNDKVSITSFRKDTVTTIVENKDIAETFQVMFNYMWDSIQ